MKAKCNTGMFLTTSNLDPTGDLQNRLWPFTMDPPTHSCGSQPRVVLERELMGGGVFSGLDAFSHLQGEIANQ